MYVPSRLCPATGKEHTAAASTLPCLGHRSFAVPGPLALLGIALYAVLVHRLMIYAPRFLPTRGHPCAVAFHFVRRGQLTGGHTPAGMRPCRAHQECAHAGRTTKKGRAKARPLIPETWAKVYGLVKPASTQPPLYTQVRRSPSTVGVSTQV